MRTRHLGALCGPIASILLSGALCGCGRAPSETAAQEHQPLASHAQSSKKAAADAPLSDSSAAAIASHGRTTRVPLGRATALGFDDGSPPSILDRLEIHK